MAKKGKCPVNRAPFEKKGSVVTLHRERFFSIWTQISQKSLSWYFIDQDIQQNAPKN